MRTYEPVVEYRAVIEVPPEITIARIDQIKAAAFYERLRKVQWFSNDPREVSENRTGSRSIWVRRGADRYPEGKRWAR